MKHFVVAVCLAVCVVMSAEASEMASEEEQTDSLLDKLDEDEKEKIEQYIEQLIAEKNKKRSEENKKRSEENMKYVHRLRDPVVSAVCSVAVTGAGQAYNGHYKKASILLGVRIVGEVLFSANSDDNIWTVYDTSSGFLPNDNGAAALGALMMIGSWWYSVIDAPINSNRINKRHQQTHMVQHDGERFSFGVDPITSRGRVGTILSMRF